MNFNGLGMGIAHVALLELLAAFDTTDHSMMLAGSGGWMWTIQSSGDSLPFSSSWWGQGDQG